MQTCSAALGVVMAAVACMSLAHGTRVASATHVKYQHRTRQGSQAAACTLLADDSRVLHL